MATFKKARHFREGRSKTLRLIVWHDMETPEKATMAEAVANFFATTDKQVSAHVCADSDSVVECVKPEDTAFAAPGANADGYQVELAGKARQSAAEWKDAYSVATIKQAARWLAPIMRKHGIPARWLTDAQLRDGKSKGMVTHAQVSRVFKQSSHTDPGTGFPNAFVAETVANEIAPRKAPSRPSQAPKPNASKPLPKWYVRPLRRGLKGSDVRALQKRLKVSPLGVFGPKTEAKVKAFQKARRLKDDGVVGPKTAREIG